MIPDPRHAGKVIPRATYRLQFSPRFVFRDAAAIAGYLADLGISHVYASPFFVARPGSTHGYDVVDHNVINPELGGESGFHDMTTALRAHGLGLIVDFVPNHMGIGGASNSHWLSVLRWGAASPYAAWFDIDWNPAQPFLTGKVLAPFLTGHYADVLSQGGLDLRLGSAPGTFSVWAHDTHELPICPAHYGEILRRAPHLSALAAAFDATKPWTPSDPGWDGLHATVAHAAQSTHGARALAEAVASLRGHAGDLASWSDLDALIARQHWRVSKFTLARDAINYRRFFAINDLAGLRVEQPEVFEATHGLVLKLLAEGLIDGIRIDHIDGLRDPRGYLQRLRERAGRPFYMVVEKILAPDEQLPRDWATDGTTGYEFANLVAGLLVNPDTVDVLTDTYREFTGRLESPEAVVRNAKLQMMSGELAAETDGLTTRLHDLAQLDPRTRDLGRHSLYTGLMHVLASYDVYRTYADDAGITEVDRRRVQAAVERGRRLMPALDPAVFDFISAALTLDLPRGGGAMLEFVARFQQASGPIMAKGLEDTALYRFNRLIALNEVGSDPRRLYLSVAAFHAANVERLARQPHSMLATSTHDTKRGEDARMRIAAISWRADLWRECVFEWRTLLNGKRALGIDPNEEYFFYQLLLGAWPAEWTQEGEPSAAALEALRARVAAAMLKSVREAARNTRWVFGDPDYEEKLSEFVARALGQRHSTGFLESFGEAAAAFGRHGASNSLVQATLKLTVPGVPDIYQGSELWEQSLVDPDNRRSIDFHRRAAMLADVAGSATPLVLDFSGKQKLALTARLLAFRREEPELFAHGSYEPLVIDGPASRRVCAFIRRYEGQALLVLTALGWQCEDSESWSWFDSLPSDVRPYRWNDLFNDTKRSADKPRRRGFFEWLPIAVLFSS